MVYYIPVIQRFATGNKEKRKGKKRKRREGGKRQKKKRDGELFLEDVTAPQPTSSQKLV